jgi:hypothetical protein
MKSILEQSELGITFELPKPVEVVAEVVKKPSKIEIFAAIEAKINEIKADSIGLASDEGEEEEDDKCCCEEKCNYLMNELGYLYSAISDIRESLWKHKEDGHLPKIPSAGKLKEILSILKLDEDYVVQPQVVYAADGKKSESFVIKAKE